MGASSSILDHYHIHISVSSKYEDDTHIVSGIAEKLREIGITVSVTDPSKSAKETCNTIKESNLVIYCMTQSYAACATQAIEYSYLAENNKPVYNVIVDRYDNRLFADHMQYLLNGKGLEASTIKDIPSIIHKINSQVLIC